MIHLILKNFKNCKNEVKLQKAQSIKTTNKFSFANKMISHQKLKI